MHFLRVNVTFYDAVNIIHDVISLANQFPDTAKFMFVGVLNGVSRRFQQYFSHIMATAHIIHVFPVLGCGCSGFSSHMQKL